MSSNERNQNDVFTSIFSTCINACNDKIIDDIIRIDNVAVKVNQTKLPNNDCVKECMKNAYELLEKYKTRECKKRKIY